MKNFLFTTYYLSNDIERNDENFQCLLKNIEHPLIDKIFLIIQDNDMPNLSNTDKIEFVHLGKRPQFSDFFEITNTIEDSEVRFIIANSDIYFDESLSKLDDISIKNKIVTLTRWDLQYDGSLIFYNKYLSQDTWIYTGKINTQIGKYFIGQHGCDNRLLAEFSEDGKTILNPSLSIKSIHVHMSQLRPYFNDPNYKYVAPPYKYSFPSGMISPVFLILKKLFFKSEFTRLNYSFQDYYYIRFEYYLKVQKGNLQKIKSNLAQRIVAIPLVLFYYLNFKLCKALKA